MIKAKHWQDPVNVVTAVLILVSPWLAGYALAQAALANAVIVGGVLLAVSIGSSVVGRAWAEWAVVALGAWMVMSSWLLDFHDGAARSASVGLGGVALVLGLWSLLDEVRGHSPGDSPMLD